MYKVTLFMAELQSKHMYFTDPRLAKDFVDRMRINGHPLVLTVSDAVPIRTHKTVLSALRELADMRQPAA